jgi:hypothetical protein
MQFLLHKSRLAFHNLFSINKTKNVRGVDPAMAEDLLYSRFYLGEKSYYIARFPGGGATMAGKLYNSGKLIIHDICLNPRAITS